MTFFYAGLFFFIIFNYIIFVTLFGDVGATIEGNPIIIIIFMWLFTGVFMYAGLSNAKKVKEKNKMYDYLELHGKLVKGLKYQMMPTGKSENNIPIYMIVADYELENGSVIKLFGDSRFDRKFVDEDGLVDAIIDPENPQNCYLDFNIPDVNVESYNYDASPIK